MAGYFQDVDEIFGALKEMSCGLAEQLSESQVDATPVSFIGRQQNSGQRIGYCVGLR